MIPKRQLAQIIARCVNIACAKIGADPIRVMTSTTKKNHPEHDVRRLVWWHLHRQGMHKQEIAKAFRRQQNGVHVGIRYAHLNLVDRHRFLLQSMPEIPRNANLGDLETLELQTTTGNP